MGLEQVDVLWERVDDGDLCQRQVWYVEEFNEWSELKNVGYIRVLC